MKTVLALLGLLGTCYVSANLVQPHHTGLTQEAQVACSKSDFEYTLTFYLDVKSDTVEQLYVVNNADPTDVSTNINLLTGTGTTADPYTFIISALGIPNMLLPLDNFAYTTGPDVMSINIMAKSKYTAPFFHNVIFPNDVLYIASCNFTEVEDKIVSTGTLTIAGDVTEAPYLVDDSATLDIVTTAGSPTNAVTLGDQIALRVTLDQPTHATGVYVHSCDICDRVDCSGLQINFIDQQGCSAGGHILPFTGRDPAVTPAFDTFTFNNQDYVHYRCLVNYCYDNADSRCDNYCNYNTQGRKKRQADIAPAKDDTPVTTFLRLTLNGQGLSLAGDQQASIHHDPSVTSPVASARTNMALLVAVIALASLLFVGLIVAMIVFYRVTAKSRSLENKA